MSLTPEQISTIITTYLRDDVEFDAPRALQAAYRQAQDDCVRVIEALPIDKARCNVLLLTEQAWEEALDACAAAIRAMK